jgi:hypothetical protein
MWRFQPHPTNHICGTVAQNVAGVMVQDLAHAIIISLDPLCKAWTVAAATDVAAVGLVAQWHCLQVLPLPSPPSVALPRRADDVIAVPYLKESLARRRPPFWAPECPPTVCGGCGARESIVEPDGDPNLIDVRCAASKRRARQRVRRLLLRARTAVARGGWWWQRALRWRWERVARHRGCARGIILELEDKKFTRV